MHFSLKLDLSSKEAETNGTYSPPANYNTFVLNNKGGIQK